MSPVTAVRTHGLTAVIVLLIVVVGLPLAWDGLRRGDLGLEVVFFPVLGAAFGYLAVSRR